MKQNVKRYTLKFQGYTWDEYFYVIAEKSGILVAYRGGLDNEGAAQMKEILYVDDADEINTIYESTRFNEIRKRVGNTDRLFFSYAEIKQKERAEISRAIKDSLFPNSIKKNKLLNVRLSCIGACALFPKELLLEI